MRAIFLVGFMGSGKTTVGEELARRLGWEFVDLDARIERHEHSTIGEIFRVRGEAAFRQAETATLREFLASPPACGSIVALGGGAFVRKENRELLEAWPTVFLEAPVDELWRRSHHDAVERPLRKDRNQFESLYRERIPSYQKATLTVDTLGKDPPSICIEIEKAFRLGGARLSGPEVLE